AVAEVRWRIRRNLALRHQLRRPGEVGGALIGGAGGDAVVVGFYRRRLRQALVEERDREQRAQHHVRGAEPFAKDPWAVGEEFVEDAVDCGRVAPALAARFRSSGFAEDI